MIAAERQRETRAYLAGGAGSYPIGIASGEGLTAANRGGIPRRVRANRESPSRAHTRARLVSTGLSRGRTARPPRCSCPVEGRQGVGRLASGLRSRRHVARTAAGVKMDATLVPTRPTPAVAALRDARGRTPGRGGRRRRR